MEQNNQQYNLKELFITLASEGLTDDNKMVFEHFLSGVLDTSQGKDVFNSSLFYNFILLLKAQPTNTFLLNHLIQEVELKSLRLTYLSLAQEGGATSQTRGKREQQSLDRQDSGMNQFNVAPVSQIIENAERRKNNDTRVDC